MRIAMGDSACADRDASQEPARYRWRRRPFFPQSGDRSACGGSDPFPKWESRKGRSIGRQREPDRYPPNRPERASDMLARCGACSAQALWPLESFAAAVVGLMLGWFLKCESRNARRAKYVCLAWAWVLWILVSGLCPTPPPAPRLPSRPSHPPKKNTPLWPYLLRRAPLAAPATLQLLQHKKNSTT